jgi:hypothetical protein
MRSTISGLALTLLLAACGVAQEVVPTRAEPVRDACVGMRDVEMERGLTELRENIERVSPLHERSLPKGPPALSGAEVVVAATRGMTSQWLARLVYCDTARHPATALAPPGARTEVTPTAMGFVIAIRSSDRAVAHDIEYRAQRLDQPTKPAHQFPANEVRVADGAAPGE